jgi:hypothetical protein
MPDIRRASFSEFARHGLDGIVIVRFSPRRISFESRVGQTLLEETAVFKIANKA